MGCARNVLAGIGCLTLLAGAAIVAYQYRAQLTGAVHSVIGDRAAPPADAAGDPGRPSEAALRSARRKEAALARPGGPKSVTVSAAEMAALVEAGLDPVARAALDSLRVTLAPGRFTLEASVRTDRIGRDALGPLAGVLDEREPLRMSGPATVAEPGRVAWRPDSLTVRAFPFPRSLVPRMVNAVTGGRDGVVPIVVPATVRAVEIRGDGVIFHRRTG
jgi:hypothetical protein